MASASLMKEDGLPPPRPNAGCPWFVDKTVLTAELTGC